MEIRGDQRGVMPADDGEDLRGVRLDRFEHSLGGIDLGRQRRDGDDLRGEPRQGSRQIGFQPQVENFHVVIGERRGQGLQGQRLGLGRHVKPDLSGTDAGLNQEDAHREIATIRSRDFPFGRPLGYAPIGNFPHVNRELRGIPVGPLIFPPTIWSHRPVWSRNWNNEQVL